MVSIKSMATMEEYSGKSSSIFSVCIWIVLCVYIHRERVENLVMLLGF